MNQKKLSTKEKILEAAGHIFAHKGYKNSTIRNIATEAQVNVAAINYHFGDKEGLYRKVLEDVFSSGFSRFPADMKIGANADSTDPQQLLRSFIHAFFYRMHSGEGWGGMSGQGRLIARELLNPGPVFDTIVKNYINPHKTLLYNIIVDIMGCDPGPKVIMSCVISIIGQCVYYALGAAVIAKISVDNSPSEDNLAQLADNVWLFSLGGIGKFKEEVNGKMSSSSQPDSKLLNHSNFSNRKEEI